MNPDEEARKVTINYTGGSLHMTIGALKSLLGANYDNLISEAEDKEVSVSSHSRTRVIGGASTSVSAHTYNYKQWPTSEAGFADGGAVVLISWAGSSGEWTGRVTGSFARFGSFLQANATSPSFFRSQRGTKYGPF